MAFDWKTSPTGKRLIFGTSLAAMVVAANIEVPPPTPTFDEDIRIGTGEADGAATQYDSQYTTVWTDGTYPLGASGGQVVVSGGVGTFTGTRDPGTYTCGNRTVVVDANFWVVGDQAQMDINAIGKTVIARKGARVTFDQISGGAWGNQSDMQGTVLTQDGPDMRGDPLLDPNNDALAGYDHIGLRRCQNVTIRDCHVRPTADGTTGITLHGNYGGDPALSNIQIVRVAEKLFQADPEGDYNTTTGTAWPSGAHGIYSESNMEIRGLSIRDCHIYGARYGIRVFHLTDWPIEIIGNRIDCCYEDLIQGGTAVHGAILQSGNYKTRPLGSSADLPGNAGPHSDGSQYLGSGGTTGPDASVTIESEWTNEWNSRAPGNQGLYFSDYSGSVGQEILIRGGGAMDQATRSLSISNPTNCTIQWFGVIPTPNLPLPYTADGFCGGITLDAAGADTDITDTFAGLISPGSATILNCNTSLRTLTTAALNAALPNRPADTTGSMPTLQEFMALFQPANGGVVDGQGPHGKVVLAADAELSDFTFASGVVDPTLSNVSVAGGSGTFTASFRTDTGFTPAFWVLEPSGTVLTDIKDIKFARSGTWVERGIAHVHKNDGDSATDIPIPAPTGIPAGTYELIFYQENGWTKESAIQSHTVTIT